MMGVINYYTFLASEFELCEINFFKSNLHVRRNQIIFKCDNKGVKHNISIDKKPINYC